ncbi:GntR family transcriptional regulator [Romboutsia lituseburensis]|uniref:GntR family transcriptional regulator n=1 Tax=Romboutsia lituseburensis DSM 797 TaxID=1121325 RepID=A0A1G9SRM7_9FIRM|nr:GntR family transcriptional regulator [Romboutsia lituseburensis]SDM38063.1 GntR family transcriptional regulator [Romboutsia lituseburensis DSM 797]
MKEPIYKNIENYVMNLIESGELKEGDLIPSEKQLTERFNVTRMTVRSALNNLVNGGYITRRRGVGSIVIGNNIYDNISTISGFTKEMENKGYKVSNIVIALDIVQADDILKEKLNLDENDNVWEIKRVRLANDEKVSYMVTYMPVKLFPNLTKEHCNGSLYKYIEGECGYKIAMSEREVTSVLSDDETESALDLESKEALLYIAQVCKLQNGDVFEYSHTYHYGYTLTLNAVPK